MTTSAFLTGLGYIILISLLLSASYAGLGRFWLSCRGIRVKYTKLLWVGLKGAGASLLVMLVVIFFSLVAAGKDKKALFELPVTLTRILLFIMHLLYVASYLYRVRKITYQRRIRHERNSPESL